MFRLTGEDLAVIKNALRYLVAVRPGRGRKHKCVEDRKTKDLRNKPIISPSACRKLTARQDLCIYRGPVCERAIRLPNRIAPRELKPYLNCASLVGGLAMVKQISRLVVLKSVVRWSGIRGGREEREDAAAKFFGCKAVGGGVEGAGNNLELFGTA